MQNLQHLSPDELKAWIETRKKVLVEAGTQKNLPAEDKEKLLQQLAELEAINTLQIEMDAIFGQETRKPLLSSLRSRMRRSLRKSSSRPPRASRLHKPPGHQLRVLAEFLFSRKVNSEVFEPLLRDLQDEYYEALASDRPFKAGWVALRGRLSFWQSAATSLALKPFERTFKALSSVNKALGDD